MFTVEVQCMAICAQKEKLMNRPAASSSVSMQFIVLPETWRHSRTCTFFDWFVLSRCVFVSSISVSCPSVVVRRPTNRMACRRCGVTWLLLRLFFLPKFLGHFSSLLDYCEIYPAGSAYTPQGRDTFFTFRSHLHHCMVPPEADSHKVTFGKGVERVDWLVRRLYLWSSEPDRVQSTYHGMCGGNTHSQQGDR